jgi:lysozyme family protein
MDKFHRSLEFVFKWEGGLSIDSSDKGGTTKFGISQRAYPALDIKNLTQEQASEIYKQDYWLKAHCDQMPWPLCLVMFDTAVNMGVKRAIGFLDEAFKRDLVPLEDHVLDQREAFYLKLATRKTMRKFLKGWLARLNDLRKTIGRIAWKHLS